MEIKVDLDRLRGKKDENGNWIQHPSGLFVGIPCYGGMMTTLTAKSIIDLNSICVNHQIPIRFSFLMNESLIPRARNYIVSEFMRSEPNFEYFIFIDADISFNAQDILMMMALDKDIICASYPKKTIKWDNIKEAVIKNPNIKSEDLEKLGGDYVFNPIAGTQNFSVSDLVEIGEAPTGFLMIKRNVFEEIAKQYPQWHYPPDHNSGFFRPENRVFAYFQDGLFPEFSERFLSEDYFFSHVARKLGYKIYMCPFVNLSHLGTYSFTGGLPAIANFLGHL